MSIPSSRSAGNSLIDQAGHDPLTCGIYRESDCLQCRSARKSKERALARQEQERRRRGQLQPLASGVAAAVQLHADLLPPCVARLAGQRH
jgi:hypothetical protein